MSLCVDVIVKSSAYDMFMLVGVGGVLSGVDNRVVRSAVVLAGGVLECNLAHQLSVALLCMLFKIIRNPLYALSGALLSPYVLEGVNCGALVAHRQLFATPCCQTSQYHRTFLPLSVSFWNNLSDPVFNGVGLAGFKSRANAFLLT